MSKDNQDAIDSVQSKSGQERNTAFGDFYLKEWNKTEKSNNTCAKPVLFLFTEIKRQKFKQLVAVNLIPNTFLTHRFFLGMSFMSKFHNSQGHVTGSVSQ